MITALALTLTACTGTDTSPTTVAGATTSVAVTSTTSAPTTTTVVDSRTPVIFDYSPTVSDIGALAFLASHPDIRLIAVTLPGTGESHCVPGVAHTRGMLELLGYGEIPVACGPEQPTTGFNAWPTTWRIASDEMDLPEADPNETRSAPQLIVDLVRESGAPVEIVTVGPLTNLSVALDIAPGFVDGLAGITIMGGAVDVAGNVFKNEVAEFNIWVDPTAAGAVFASGAPVTLIPLDATNFLPSGRVFFDALDGVAATPPAELVRDVWLANGDWIDNADGFLYFWDELAAAVMVDESIVEFETRTLVVDDDLRENKGWTREDPSGHEVRVAISADRLAFEQLFIDTIVGSPVEFGYLEASPEEIAYLKAVAEIGNDREQGFELLLSEVAAELGFDPDAGTDDDFLLVFSETIRRGFDSFLADELVALEALNPPQSLDGMHQRVVEITRRLIELKEEILVAFEESGFDGIANVVDLMEACSLIAAEIGIRMLDLEYGC